MPPIKEYTFRHIVNKKITIVIKDYDFEGALIKLSELVFDMKIFKLL